MKRLNPALGLTDHVIATFGCILAIYSIGMSLGKQKLTIFFLLATLFAAVAGYLFSVLLAKSKFASYDSYFWAVLGVLTTCLVGPLNSILPEDGFPPELVAAGILCWLLLVGNLFAWRDQTILFLTLPCIAIFGLVGTFDTFRGATILFFAFMMSIALLYARVHQRSMIERAQRAGVEETELLRRGPWKWMAGPEWALGSALVIVIFSFMGAPVLRGSLQAVAGQVTIALPQANNTRQTITPQRDTDVGIGQGPVTLTEAVVMKVKMDMPRYLRLNSFTSYTGNGWSVARVSLPENSPLIAREPSQTAPVRGENGGLKVWVGHDLPPQEPIKDGKTMLFETKGFDRTYGSIIAPGPVVEVMGDPSEFSFLKQGWVNLKAPLQKDRILQSYVRVPTRSASSKKAKLPEALKPIGEAYYSKENIPARIRDLAYRVSETETSDYKKISAMRKAIEGAVLYNINTPRTPTGKDPCDYFMFESKQGYCDVFASTMVLMARSIGLPSRYTIGYIVNDPNLDETGYYTIKDKDFHAWAEVYFEDIGWIVIDPTAGATSVDGGGRGDSAAKVPWYKTSAFIGTVSGVIVLAIAAPFAFAFWKKRTRGPVTRKQAIGEIAKLYGGFTKSLEKFCGKPKRFSQTSREFVDAISLKLADNYNAANTVSNQFEVAMFSPRALGREALTELATNVAKLKADLARAKKEKP